MEIKEIISYFLNPLTNVLDVSFRTTDDNEDVVRIDNIDYTHAEEYGFNLETDTFGFYDDEFDEDGIFEEDKIELDEDELTIFLNEYYMVNPDSLPKSEIY